jgi:hypothetical protein
MKIEVEIGGRTKVGRALERILVIGTTAACDVLEGEYERAQGVLASELFRAAVRAGWRPKRAGEK